MVARSRDLSCMQQVSAQPTQRVWWSVTKSPIWHARFCLFKGQASKIPDLVMTDGVAGVNGFFEAVLE